MLIIEGEVGGDKAEDVKKFTKAAHESVLEGLDPRTAVIEIEVKLSVGSDFIPIREVGDISTMDEVDINHKPG